MDFGIHGGSWNQSLTDTGGGMTAFDLLIISETSGILTVGRSVANIVSLTFYGAILQKLLPL